MAFDDYLGRPTKDLVIVWDFVDSPELTAAPWARFFSRHYVPPTGPKPGDNYAFVGAYPLDDRGSSLDPARGSLTIGDSSFAIADEGGRISSFIANNALAGKYVIRRIGFVGMPWDDFLRTSWQIKEYRTGGRMALLYQFVLENTLSQMKRPIYENYHRDWSAVGINEDYYSPNLGDAKTKVKLERDVEDDWRPAGWAMFHHEKKGLIELITYDAISGKWLDPIARRRWGFGYVYNDSGNPVGIDFKAKRTMVVPGWAERDNPVDLAMRWFTRTSAGSNGAWDDGLSDGTRDREGLGIPVDLFDTTEIQDIRDQYCPQPTWGGGMVSHVTAGVAVMVFQNEGIKDTKSWVESHLLLPYGLWPSLTYEEKWTIRPINPDSITDTQIGDKWIRGATPAKWRRGYRDQTNKITVNTNYAPNGEPWYEKIYEDTAYPPGKAMTLEGKGGWVGIYNAGSKATPGDWDPPDTDPPASNLGWGPHANPNYQSDRRLRDGGVEGLFALLGKPQSRVEIVVPFEFLKVALGDYVRVRLPWVLNEQTGNLGENDRFLVIKKRVDWRRARIKLGLLSVRDY